LSLPFELKLPDILDAYYYGHANLKARFVEKHYEEVPHHVLPEAFIRTALFPNPTTLCHLLVVFNQVITSILIDRLVVDLLGLFLHL